nr:hypothetical protein BaRGS_033833 [Batillaria attramentaria]
MMRVMVFTVTVWKAGVVEDEFKEQYRRFILYKVSIRCDSCDIERNPGPVLNPDMAETLHQVPESSGQSSETIQGQFDTLMHAISSQDLTKNQAAELQNLRQQGKTGFYRNGRLHVEDRGRPGGQAVDRDRRPMGDNYSQHSRHLSRRDRKDDSHQYTVHGNRRHAYDHDDRLHEYDDRHFDYGNWEDWPVLGDNSDPTLKWFGDPAVREDDYDAGKEE